MIAPLNPRSGLKWTKVHRFFSPIKGRIAVDHLVFRFWISLFVPGIFTVKLCIKSFQTAPHLACFPSFFAGEGGRQALKFLDWYYKTEYVFVHVAKFRGDRQRDLEDLALKKNSSRPKT